MITYGGYRAETLRQFLGGANNDLLYRSTQDTGTTWTKWYKFVLLPSGSDKKTFEAIGGTTTPVYVNSSGIITAGTTLGGAAYKAENYYALASHGIHVTTATVKTALDCDTSTTNQWLNKKGEWSTPTAAQVGAATSDHNHDSTYLKLSGGTITGWLYIKNDNDGPRIYLGSNDSTGASGGFIYMAMAQTNSIYRPNKYNFRIFSYNSSTGATDSSHYETYSLP
jgi:hypothetical protein